MAHLLIIAVLAVGCGRSRPRAPEIGEAFVAPMTLNLRTELSLRAAVAATVKHGERLAILEHRRKFVKVRTSREEEGWADRGQLLSPKGMANLESGMERARKLPSQGRVSPFDTLNVHLAPNRMAPSFAQIEEATVADLVDRVVLPRGSFDPEKDVKYVFNVPEGALKDDWSLIRLPDARSGWVLSRMLMMNLPDEVMELAEGHRITSFFALDAVRDRGQNRNIWLWTTITTPPESYQYDSVRVFFWNSRRKRYETGFRERNLRGYYPIQVEPAVGTRTARFVLLCSAKDGVLHRRTYELREGRVRLVEKIPWQREERAEPASAGQPVAAQGPKPPRTRWEQFTDWVQFWKR